jgi:hypothetical protein
MKDSPIILSSKAFAYSVFAMGMDDYIDYYKYLSMIRSMSESFGLPNYQKNMEMWDEWMSLNQAALNLTNINASNYWNKSPNYIHTNIDTDDLFIVQDPDVITPHFNIKAISLLKHHKQIPDFYVIRGQRTQSPSLIHKDIGHYMWVANTLARSTSFSNDPDTHSLIKQFIIEHKDKLDKIRSSFSKEPKELGFGMDGVAYDIGNGMVLKLFFSENAYNHAIAAINRLHTNQLMGKTEAMIYDAGKLGNFLDKTLYYYMIEKVSVINEKTGMHVEEIVEFVITYVKSNLPYWKELLNRADAIGSSEFSNIIYKRVNECMDLFNMNRFNKIAIDIINKDKTIDLQEDWFPNLIEEVIMKLITNRGDLHRGNIGVTQAGYFRIFDPVKDNDVFTK